MRYLLVLTLVLAALPARPAPSWTRAVDGLEYRVTTYRGAQLHQVRVDPTKRRLDVALASDHGRPAMSVAELKDRTGALAAFNASYFDGENRPLGYLQSGSRVIVDAVATGGAFGGVFLLDEEEARIVHRSDFEPGSARLALQAGPRLLEGGRKVEGVHPGDARQRTGVAVDREGKIVLYAVGLGQGLTMTALQDALLALGFREALNLDGGSSTQMMVEAGGVKAVVAGFVPVPVALVVKQ